MLRAALPPPAPLVWVFPPPQHSMMRMLLSTGLRKFLPILLPACSCPAPSPDGPAVPMVPAEGSASDPMTAASSPPAEPPPRSLKEAPHPDPQLLQGSGWG